jgi:hypothetical protein
MSKAKDDQGNGVLLANFEKVFKKGDPGVSDEFLDTITPYIKSNDLIKLFTESIKKDEKNVKDIMVQLIKVITIVDDTL